MHWRDFFLLLGGHRRHLAAMGAVLAISAAIPLAGPLLLRAFVDRAIAGEPADRLVPLAVGYVCLALVGQALAVGVVYVSTSLVWQVTNDLRVGLARHVLGLGLAFHQRNSPGSLAERVDGDLTAVADYLATFVVRVVGALLTVVGAVVVLLFIDWRLAVLFAAYAGAAGVTFLKIRDAGVVSAADERGAQSRLSGDIEEQLVGQQDLRASGAGGYALGRFHHNARAVLGSTVELERSVLWLWHTATLAVGGGAVVALVSGTLAFRAGWITLGTAFLLFQYTQVLQQPLEAMVEQLQDVQKASGGMHRVRALLDEQRPDRPRGRAAFPGSVPALVFRGTELSYDDEEDRQAVLRCIDLEIPSGESLGLMGRTGSGKTTMMRLATGLLAPTGGRVLLGDIDVWSIEPAALSAHIGVVPQEVRLFAASVRENVTLFDPTVEDRAVVEVLERVGLADRLLGNRDALDVELGGDAAGLSAGEAQLLALARVFLRDPRFVVLDEATARIDPSTEARLRARHRGGVARPNGTADRSSDLHPHPRRSAGRARRRCHRRTRHEGRPPGRCRCLRPARGARRERGGRAVKDRSTARPGVWKLSYRVATNRSDLFWTPWIGWFLFFVSPVIGGLIMRLIFDAVADPDSGSRPYVLIAAFSAVEIGRRLVVHSAALVWIRSWVMMQAVQQANMLECQVVGGGPDAGPLVDRPGEIVSRFRDDPEDVAWFVDSWVDVSGAAAFAVLAGMVLVSIDPAMALVVFVPMVGVGVLTRVLGALVKQAHRADLEAASRVNGVLRDVFQAAPVLDLHGAVEDALSEVERRGRVRRRTAVRNRALTESIGAASWSSADVAIGLALLVSVGSMRSGEFTIGDLALVVSYMSWLAFFPRMMGQLLTRRRQAEVAFERMEALTGSGVETVVRPRPMRIDEPDVEPDRPEVLRRRPLRTLTVRGLTATFDGAGGVSGADLDIERGTLTVVAGPVGAGKTSLLRALIGLIPSTGSVRWNGEEIADLGAFMVPPHCAYLAQVPALFTDTLMENVRLGARVSDDEVRAAIATAALEDDVADMPHGADTLVGSRGVRLSGGQRQRLAVARARVRDPELLVIDDLSSAVDVETEVALWSHLRAEGRTVLAVSNRALALRRADQVVELP